MTAALALFRAIDVLGRPVALAPAAIGGLFGGGRSRAPDPPPPKPVVPMPDFDDPAIAAARRKVLEQAAARSGRASTILAGGDGDYNGNKLGVA